MATHSMRTATVVEFGRLVIDDTKKITCTGMVCFANRVKIGFGSGRMIGSAKLRSHGLQLGYDVWRVRPTS